MEMNYYVDPITINSDNINLPQEGNTLFETRKYYSNSYCYNTYAASIVVTCYNRLQKTKNCIHSILKYTTDVNYELILIDNGCNDGTYDFLQSIPFENKRIIKVTKNIGSGFAMQQVMKMYQGKYLVSIANDIIVTSNWLSNLIRCYESDPSIGFAVPISTNVSNLQEVNKSFKDIEEVQRFADKNNKYDPQRWKQRMRLVNTISVLKREVMDVVGLFDYAFLHDFGEDDFSIRVRRAGYKLILCEDTFVHHDHDFRNMEDKDPEEYRKSLEVGRANYRHKYYGLDAWDDVNNYEINLINMLDSVKPVTSKPHILGVDVKMGAPVLEIKNKLREQGIMDCFCTAFTSQAKYYTDLQTICDQNVYADRIDYIFEYFEANRFDFIILGESLNNYSYPVKLLQRLIEFAKPGATILLKVKNLNGVDRLVTMLGENGTLEDSMMVNININELIEVIKVMGYTDFDVISERLSVDHKSKIILEQVIKSAKLTNHVQQKLNELLVDHFLICIRK